MNPPETREQYAARMKALSIIREAARHPQKPKRIPGDPSLIAQDLELQARADSRPNAVQRVVVGHPGRKR